MIDVSQLPAVRAQLERDAAELKEKHTKRLQAQAKGAAPRYARAPAAAGPQQTGDRPPAVQRSTR